MSYFFGGGGDLGVSVIHARIIIYYMGGRCIILSEIRKRDKNSG